MAEFDWADSQQQLLKKCVTLWSVWYKLWSQTDKRDRNSVLLCTRTTVKSQQTCSSFSEKSFCFISLLLCFVMDVFCLKIFAEKISAFIKVGKKWKILPKKNFLNGSGSHQTVQPSVKQKTTFSDESREKKQNQKKRLYCTLKLFRL